MRPRPHSIARLSRIATIALVGWLTIPAPAEAAIWYLGNFAGSTPSDDADCGTGKGAHPAPHPCASLAHWTASRAAALAAGDVVRLTGTFGPVASGAHCIIPRADVTYEGRTANDEQPVSFDDAVVDAAATLGYPCHSGAINCRGDSACLGFSRFTLRYLTLANANGAGGEGNQLVPGNTVQTGLVIDHVRFTGSHGSGLLIGSAVSNEDNPCNGVRNVKNITVRDSQFDHNTRGGPQAGLWLTCTDGGLVERCSAFDNRGADKTAADCNADDDQEGCDGRNGFHIGGWINGALTDSVAYRNGYYNYNFSGNGPSSVCDAPTYNLLVSGCSSHDAPSAHFSFSHCNHDITVRNSYAWGHGLAVNQYACAYRLSFYNNTFWTRQAVQLFANCRECDFRNNIMHCDSPNECVYVDFASRHPLTTWQNNVVVNAGAGSAVAVYSSSDECVGTPGDACDCPGAQWLAVCPNSDPQSPGCPSPWKDSIERKFFNADLAAFTADAMFGDETGGGDHWGVTPAFLEADPTSVADLHLTAGDTVARDAAAPIPASRFGDPPVDADGDRRPAGIAWDIGADEVTATQGTCEGELADCLDTLGTCPSSLASCQADLAACQSLPLLQDADQDGTPNVVDRCADTPAQSSVDAAGCSPQQFCGAIDATTSPGKKLCKKLDWGNDEPLMKAREADCVVAKNGKGTLDDRCIPATP